MGITSSLLKNVLSKGDLPLDLTNEFELQTGQASNVCRQSLNQDSELLQRATSPCRKAPRELLQTDFWSWTQTSHDT